MTEARSCRQCGADTSHKRAGAMFCGVPCKSASRSGPREFSECVVCGDDITHLFKVAKYCGGSCSAALAEDRVEAHLERKRGGHLCGWCDRDISSRGGHYRYCSPPCKSSGNREYWREWARSHRSRDVEAARERDRRHYALKSAQVKAKVNRRRARVLGNDSRFVSARDVDRLLSRPCAYCECCKSEEIDHVVPIARGGRDAIGNLVGACSFCNRSKNDKLLVEWRQSFRKGVVSTHA